MLVELNVVEQRYRVVLEVLEDGLPVTEVAIRHGVSRQAVHTWLRRYREAGMAGLVDRSRRPPRCAHQISAEMEGMVCDLRRHHPRWGPWRLVHELRRQGVAGIPGRTSIYRVLDRNQLIEPFARRRQRAVYRRWERSRPMELRQMDVVSFHLADCTVVSLLTGVDDHSRFCVCAGVMQRADARSVCTAFSAALGRHGVPDQLLTDNGRVFTGRLTRPHPAVVLFDRICQQQGIRHLLTKPAHPTTTGKIERFHRTLRVELLDNAGFTSLETAQLGINAYIVHYNTERPHRALGAATPAERFTYDETARGVAPPVTDAELPGLVQLFQVAQRPVATTRQQLRGLGRICVHDFHRRPRSPHPIARRSISDLRHHSVITLWSSAACWPRLLGGCSTPIRKRSRCERQGASRPTPATVASVLRSPRPRELRVRRVARHVEPRDLHTGTRPDSRGAAPSDSQRSSRCRGSRRERRSVRRG